jgi:hypothetical protein
LSGSAFGVGGLDCHSAVTYLVDRIQRVIAGLSDGAPAYAVVLKRQDTYGCPHQ